MNVGGSLGVVGDFTLGDAGGHTTLVQNYGTVSVSGNVVAGDNTGVNNYSGASFQVSGAYTAGADSYVYDYGAAAFRVTDDFTLGDYGFLYNGANFTSTDAATFTVGGSLSIGTDGFVFQYGKSALNATGDFTLGDSNNESYLYNGVSSTDAATLTVGGSLSIGAGDSAYAYNYGASTISVGGDFTLGGSNGGSFYNGFFSPTDTATLTVGGNLSIGDGVGVCLQLRHLNHQRHRRLHSGQQRRRLYLQRLL